MRIGFIGDVHLSQKPWPGRVISARTRFDVGLSTLVDAVQTLGDAGCELIVLLGDVFDSTKTSWEAVHATASSLVKPQGPGNLLPAVHVVSGNHDMTVNNRRSTGPCCFLPDLSNSAGLISHRGVGCVRALDFTTADNLLNRLRFPASAPGASVLACHIGVASEDTPDFMRAASDVVDIRELAPLCEALRISHVFAGNWHTPRTDTFMGVTVHQLGVLNPVGFGDYGLNRGRVAVYDTDSTLTEYLQIPGVRFLELESIEEFGRLQDDPSIASLCARLSVPLEEFSNAGALIDLALAGAPAWLAQKLNSIDVRPRRADVRARAVEALQTTAATIGLEPTVRSFCAASFPAETAAGVADTALRYLRGN